MNLILNLMRYSACDICDTMINHPPPPPPMPNDTPTAICDDFGRAGEVGEWVWLTHSSQTGMFLTKYIIYCVLTKPLHSYNHPLPRSSCFESFFCHLPLARNTRRRSCISDYRPSDLHFEWGRACSCPPSPPLLKTQVRRLFCPYLPSVLRFEQQRALFMSTPPPLLETRVGGLFQPSILHFEQWRACLF